MSDAKTVCPVCPRHCALAEGGVGFCRARKAENGGVVCAQCGALSALSLDPIEKKPFARFHPGAYILSAGGYGCNMRCAFCQNHEISQCAAPPDARQVAPGALVDEALRLRGQGNIGLAFTYNEPAVTWEYMRDAARLAKPHGLLCAMVTNGYFCDVVLQELDGLIDAFNIDLKCFTDEGYRALGGGLADVQATIAGAARFAHVEVTTLVVPGLSDGEDDMAREAQFLANIDRGIPLHLSRYFPRWQSDVPATDVDRLHKLAAIAREYLAYVYVGNC